jgi:hypothetical protein
MEDKELRQDADKLYYALAAYVKAQCNMLNKWAEGDEAVKKQLWLRLHGCEIKGMEALEAWEKHVVKVDNQ